MLTTDIYFFNDCGRLMVADANLFTRNNSADLIKERSNPKFIIDCTYKFKIFKLSSILFFYIY